ncbi:Fanconi anemia group D2 protein [Wyeomyia smithii]|uniref:Fanconi anemia group D2 protein n=1 Tax=Wyeomyia smithii TaxID=174621 RepID=UPI00246801DF|nr:Fanconi anemia group D2 protein [Wyeomyia smithii]XP_055546503.1 Fanconi anemia group D2 protein [Wyeomyia smithii]
MFKNRKSALVAKKPSELSTIRETESVTSIGASGQPAKQRRLNEPTENEDENDPFMSSQFSVPASQMNSQRRYLSQRSNLQKSQSARTSRRVPTNYYETILLKCAIDLDDPVSVVLRCEPLAFVRQLRTMLRSSPEYPRNVKDFVNGVEQASRNRDAFRKLLECCQMQNQTTQEVKQVQESLMKLLLCVDFMQLELIGLLFDYVERSASESTDGAGLAGLVLSQIKFIDHTSHGTFVFNRYFEMLERTGRNKQLLEAAIISLEDVIDVTKHDVAFRRILDLFSRSGDLFTISNVSVFCEMCLSNSTLRITRQKILDYVEGGCNVESYPTLIRFLLKFNTVELDGLHDNIQLTRQVIERLILLHENSGVNDRCLTEIFQFILQALTVSSLLYESWIKYCRLLTDEESHMSLDLLTMLMMLTVNEIRSGTIQKMLINKIRKGHITISHMKDLTVNFGCVLKTHLDGALDFVESCLKEKQSEVCEFGIKSMGYLFSADSMNNRMVLNKLIGFMCEMALINGGRRNDHMIAVCMDALSTIYENYPTDIRNNAHVLLKIMDISLDLNLQQYRMAVELICDALRIPDSPLESNETWDDLNIVIKKQLLSANKEVKKKGVVGVVCLIHHMLKHSSTSNAELNCSFDSEKTIETASEIPTAAGREIGNMINMMLTSSNESPDILALCYDELAEMLQAFERDVGKPEKGFSVWMCDVLTNDFQNYFIAEEIPSGGPVQYAKKLCINDTDDVENTNAEAFSIAVNIAENMLTFNSRYSSMCFFLAMFKLMRTLQGIRYGGNLESINALLGCAVIVPIFYQEADEKTMIETYEEDVCRQLLDAYFYIANWFRELINAFITQKDSQMHRKVLQRLTALVSLEQRLAALLRHVDFDYYPPTCDFSIKVQLKPSKQVAKESTSKPNVTLNVTKTQLPSSGKSRATDDSSEFDTEISLLRHRKGFRPIESNIVQLFRESLILSQNLPHAKIGTNIGLSEYRFLLDTVTSAVESMVTARAKSTCNYQFKDLLKVAEYTASNFVKIKAKRLELKSATDPVLQSELKALNCCFNWSLRLFTAILQLAKLQHQGDINFIIQKLHKMIELTSPMLQSDEDQIEAILTAELNHRNAFKDLYSASCLFKFGLALASISPSPSVSSTIATFCQKFICSNFRPKSGTSNQLCLLLQGLTSTADFPKIKQLGQALNDDLVAAKDDERHFAGLQRSHYPVLFKELSKAFIKCVQSGIRSNRTTVQKFVLWEQTCEILKHFSETAKQADSSKMYACYMRYSHTCLKLFQQTGLKVLEDVLKVSADKVSHLLSTLQHSTRYLHNICCHSKNVKDNSLIAQIPFIRETVETLIYSVKALLAATGCASVFWMGNLKNKDLKGELVLSQGSEIELAEESASSDIGDFLSDDESADDPQLGVLRRTESKEKSSQSKCF